MFTKGMTGAEVLKMARDARAKAGPGVNESIPMTPRVPFRMSKTQVKRDGEIAKELVYLADVAHDPNMLLAAYYENRARLSDQRYWEFLKLAWVLAGKIETIPVFREMFASKRPFRNWIMSPEEEAKLNALPEEFLVWRAPRQGGDDGISWSVRLIFVAAYAQRAGREVLEKRVKKSDVIAYFDRAGEEEIILL